MSILDASRLNRELCPIGRAAGVIGDKWILLILRECFFGFGRFEDFQKNLTVSRSVLAKKLSVMVESGILEKYSPTPGKERSRQLYKLTERGNGLINLFVGLYQWGAEFLNSENLPASYRLTAKNSGSNIQMKIVDELESEISQNELRIKLSSKSFSG